ncbi:MAG: hypothetical protein IPG10_12065 [Flavobacteriales bacterium]|nr:hypothetical protein [Flavobacteriales bacterium]
MIRPAMPFTTCSLVCMCRCGWYQCVDARSNTAKEGLHVSPAAMGVCGPPSASGGTCMPCQWMVLGSPNWLLTFIVTVWPCCRMMVGPSSGPFTPMVCVSGPGRKGMVPVPSSRSITSPLTVSGRSNWFCAATSPR